MLAVEVIVVVFLAASLGIALRLWTPGIGLWAVFAMTGQMTILAYAHLSAHFGASLAGRANTALNLLVFLGAFAIQYAVGVVLDFWTADPVAGYPAEAWTVAFGSLFALQTASWLLYRFTRG